MRKIYTLLFVLFVWEIVVKNIGSENVTIHLYPNAGEHSFELPVASQTHESFDTRGFLRFGLQAEKQDGTWFGENPIYVGNPKPPHVNVYVIVNPDTNELYN